MKKPFLFVIILLLLILGTEIVLDNAGDRAWKAMEDIHKYPDSYDVCFLGPSTAMTNISHQELYERYGIAGISLAEPLQPLYMGKYVLEELLEYQSPKVVFLDTSPMFYSEKEVGDWTYERENYILEEFLDGIENPVIRWKALCNAWLYNRNFGFWDYLKLSYTHENWKNIIGGGGEEEINEEDNANGNLVLLGRADKFADADIAGADAYTQQKRTMNEKAEKQVAEMAKMCRQKGTELILVTEKLFLPEEEHDEVAAIARANGITYIDINENIEKAEISYREDLADSVHFNLSGAVKWSCFIGDYLSENYEITDKRDDPAYDRYKEHSTLYNAQKESLSGPDFHEYLSQLAAMDQSGTVIFVSVYDDAANSLKEEDLSYLRALGLETDLTGKSRSSYGAVIYDGRAWEEFAPEDTVSITGNIDGLYYKVTSGGLLSGKQACIELNDVDYMQKGRGFNIVVYDLKTNKITDSVYFDTYAYENPRKGWEIREEFTGRSVSFPEGTFHGYLTQLAALDKSQNAIFISVYDEATNSLSDQDVMLLQALGLKTDLRGQNRCSYAAVIDSSGVREEFSLEDTVEISGNADGLSYRVTSGGLTSGGNASIKLDGTEYIQKGRGFNFVIYNLISGRVEDSVSFDTYVEENPQRTEENPYGKE